MRTWTAAIVLGCVFAGSGCRSFSPERRTVQVESPAVRTSTGVLYEELMQGQGPAAATGDEILLDYVLSLDDGTRVDSTLDRGVPVRVVLGKESIVRGLDDGLAGICAAGRRRITVPPELGYGDSGVEGLVPPNATLVFEVHAVEVRPN